MRYRNIAENFNRLSRVHEYYRRPTTDRRTGDSIIANAKNIGSRIDMQTHDGNISTSHQAVAARVASNRATVTVFVTV